MGYEYDSKVNRELAKTAMQIYLNSHTPKKAEKATSPTSLTEATQQMDNTQLQSVINSLLLEYVSDVVVLAEQQIGRELYEQEIQAFSLYLLENIEGLGDEGKVRLINELASVYN